MKVFIILSLVINVLCPPVYMHHVFIYGTLKKGQPNHSIITNTTIGQAEFLAYARTVEPYPLVIATKNNYPFLLNLPGKGQRVHGEIYSVDQKMLDFLDEFEECPELYQRTKVQLEVQDGDDEGENTLKPGSIEEAFVYSTNKYEPEWLLKPTYDNYDTNGDHGLPYHEDTSPE
ncbi:gamma-glutamylaminecyclotransferase C-like [Carassius gibelio]|uniref:gamma-glutamylaminecyclotransferase C-like n=1 Tax=Carassius gibelio TaxID=101364 RepID=UPI002279495A|nr:gamma-glutamylaminecyclotransferase C-like [Carassius gibelio]